MQAYNECKAVKTKAISTVEKRICREEHTVRLEERRCTLKLQGADSHEKMAGGKFHARHAVRTNTGLVKVRNSHSVAGVTIVKTFVAFQWYGRGETCQCEQNHETAWQPQRNAPRKC